MDNGGKDKTKVKVMSRQGHRKAMGRSWEGHGKVMGRSRLGQSKVKATQAQPQLQLQFAGVWHN